MEEASSLVVRPFFKMRDRAAWPVDWEFFAPLDVIVRHSIESCAAQVLIPELPDGSIRQLQKSLPYTLAARTKVIDPNLSIRDSVATYLKPIATEFYDKLPPPRGTDILRVVANDLYYLTLSASYGAPSHMDLDRLRRHMTIVSLLEGGLTGEAAARMAVIRGAFLSVDESTSIIPSLKPLPGIRQNLKERLNEILEDAHLAEAGFLRRMFSFETNKTSIKRDLRRILSWIVRNAPWARGVTALGEDLLQVPGKPASEALKEMVKGTELVPDKLVINVSDFSDHLSWYTSDRATFREPFFEVKFGRGGKLVPQKRTTTIKAEMISREDVDVYPPMPPEDKKRLQELEELEFFTQKLTRKEEAKIKMLRAWVKTTPWALECLRDREAYPEMARLAARAATMPVR